MFDYMSILSFIFLLFRFKIFTNIFQILPPPMTMRPLLP